MKHNQQSFITNRALLQNINPSSHQRHHQHTVSLLTKKKVNHLHTVGGQMNQNEESGCLLRNRVGRILFACKEQIDKNSKLQRKIDKVLLQMENGNLQQPKKQDSQAIIQNVLISKLELAFKEKTILRIQNQQLKLKIDEAHRKLAKWQKKARKESLGSNGYRGSQKDLENLVIHQSLIIDKQSEQKDIQIQQLMQMMRIQALKIEQMIPRQPKQKSDRINISCRNIDKGRHFNNLH